MKKACPEDEFHLPNIDKLVEPLLDTQYFPLWMVLAVTIRSRWAFQCQKTAFSPIGNFHYTIMSYGLKNADVTYQ